MLLYRAAQEGVFGRLTRFECGSIADALFIYLDGTPEPKSVEALAAGYLSRPWVCLTDAWESLIRQQFPHARVVMRALMKPARRFCFPAQTPLPENCRVAAMGEEAFNAHPFGHGANYPSYEAFQAEGSGAVIWRDEYINPLKSEDQMIQFSRNTQGHACDTSAFSRAQTKDVRRVHGMIAGYAPTALRELPELANRLGVRAVFIKDESSRFGLKAFKGLGGIYAMYRMICDTLALDPETTTLDELRQPPHCDKIRELHFATTTDGNHGKGVSWAAGVFGCHAHIFMPKGSVEVRAQAIRDAGSAEVTITDMAYDDCVAWTSRIAEESGWLLIQDTSWDGYEQVPLWIMQGYTTLFYEAMDQMKIRPTHLFLQAGVGAMAGAIAGAALETCPSAPIIATVEAEQVACFYESFKAGDGLPHRATGSGETIMAGLNCAVPCTLAWDILGGCAIGGFACSDEVTERGMRLLSRENPPIVAGESGAVTAGLAELLAEAEYRDLRKALRLDRDSVILLINTEGDTDPENYRSIVCVYR